MKPRSTQIEKWLHATRSYCPLQRGGNACSRKVTTTQGVSLSKEGNAPEGYRGIVRNVEDPNDRDLQLSRGYINDVHMPECAGTTFNDKTPNACSFSSFLPHLAEGGPSARKYFKALKKNGIWALNDKLTGIHCCGLEDEDFAEMAKHDASMVWSPLSNLLLYGLTAMSAQP